MLPMKTIKIGESLLDFDTYKQLELENKIQQVVLKMKEKGLL